MKEVRILKETTNRRVYGIVSRRHYCRINGTCDRCKKNRGCNAKNIHGKNSWKDYRRTQYTNIVVCNDEENIDEKRI